MLKLLVSCVLCPCVFIIMSKIKLTKGELKRQRDALAQFSHYLPILQLKKKQLQIKIEEIRRRLIKKRQDLKQKEDNFQKWINLLGDPQINIIPWLSIEYIRTSLVNIAGADIPVFESIKFKDEFIDFYQTPFWIDQGIAFLREYVQILIEVDILKQQIEILKKELMTTTQRVNLFEKVKIPECIENIRVIRIYLGDLQANAVGIGKIAKKKIEARELAEMAA